MRPSPINLYKSIQTHLYRIVKGPPRIDGHRNERDILILTNLILLPLATNMREPFHEVCVRIVQSLDS
jgi:hypothetical protein